MHRFFPVVKENSKGEMRLSPFLLTTAFPKMSGSDWIHVSRAAVLLAARAVIISLSEYKALCYLNMITKMLRHPLHFTLKRLRQ